MKKIIFSLLIFTQAISAFFGFESPTQTIGQSQDTALACFFLSSPGLIRNDQDVILDRYKTFEREPLRNFEQNFMSDAILHAFIKALCLKEKHIFISYATWENYQSFAQLIRSRLRELGITNPEEQLYVPKNKSRGSIFYSSQAKTPSTGSLPERKKQFKQSLQHLGNRWAELVIPLFMFDPQDWYMYDTTYGLYYLTPRESFNANTCPVNIQAMRPITDINNVQRSTQQNRSFIYTVKSPLTDNYFDIDYAWTENINNILKKTTQWSVYFIGHGFPHNTAFESNILGMPARGGKLLFAHLNEIVKPHAIYMSSCYWYPERVVALLNGRCDTKTCKTDKPFNCEFVTAAGGHYPALEYDAEICVSRYRPAAFGKKKEFSLVHKDTSTYELARKTAYDDTQTIRTNINKHIKEFKTAHYDISPTLVVA